MQQGQRIKSGEQTILLVKTSEFFNFISIPIGNVSERPKARFEVKLKDKETEQYLGPIIINGYEICTKFWLHNLVSLLKISINELQHKKGIGYEEALRFEYGAVENGLLDNISGLCNEFNIGKDNFKDEKEIVIFKIERVVDNNV